MSGNDVAVVIDGIRFRSRIRTGQTLSLGREPGSDVHLPPAVTAPSVTVHLDDQAVTVRAGGETVTGWAGPGWTGLEVAGNRIEVQVVPASQRSVYDLGGRDEFLVGPQPGASVTTADPALSLSARRADGGRWLVSVAGSELFVNNVRQGPGRTVVRDGDHLGFGAHDLIVFDRELHVNDHLVARAGLPRKAYSVRVPPDGYPDVRRSPRIVHRPPEGTIVVNAVPAREDNRTGQLAKLIIPPVLMLAVTATMAFLNGNPLMVIASGTTSVVTLFFSVSGFFKERRKSEAQRVAEESVHRAHLVQRSIDIHAAGDSQRRGAEYHYPDVATLADLAAAYSPRVFEKTATQFDFLCYRLGLGTAEPSRTIHYADRDRVAQGTELDELARQLCESSATLDRLPIAADLVHGPVGYVGPRRLVVEQLQLLVNQLAFFHSYHDLQLIVVFPESEHDDWSWMRWYRHSSLQNMNVRGFVYDQRSRDQVLSSLNQILKARQNALSETRGGQSTSFAPHYVVVILDETLVMDHVVMEFLRADPRDLGCSVVVVQETMSSLPDSITTVIDIRDRDTGVLVLEQGELKNTPFVPDHFPDGFDKELLPRTVGALNHLQDLKSSIPESVTFLELYEVERFEDLGVMGRWGQNSPHRTLGVPLGLRGAGDVVKLDLHEKAHGPHGLVAGTTGSGKSEIIQSYILSLAVNFHPHDVAFLLIDYKGGGMANLFADLPHLLGTITNLDGAQSMRALVSINAELKRRQRVFSENNVNHINQYQKLVKNGDAAEPMPHLFLISDEFAELKSEQPEFMDELISTARIGRSLGIHLILATQKPSGVVNDQIWSNSKFKLALKVADRSDSMEIIKTPDAAEITLPGRAYLQVGNNEIYELFQSAWSGADYEPEKEDNRQEDHTIYAINDLGQYEILNSDLSGLDGADEVKQIPTELEAIVQGVAATAVAAAIEPLPRPWLPPLAERMYVSDLHPGEWTEAWREPKTGMRPVIGMVDVPSMQAQQTLRLNLSGDGHLALFASPGYGKSTFLQTLVMDLARTHNPEHLHVYLLDFGTNGLLPLRGLPHVADTVTIDDDQKTGKFLDRIESEIKRRKQLLSGYSVANLEMYERASGQVLPHLLLVVDGFEGLKESGDEDSLTALMYGVAREGAGLGIHLVLSAGRHASLRSNLTSNIKTQIALKMNDDSQPRAIVGRTTLQIDDLPGRGLVRVEQPEIFQAALPARGEEMLEVIETIQAEASEMDAHWQGARPEVIPVIPETLELDDFLARPETARLVTAGVIPIGLGFDTVAPAGIDPTKHRQALVLCGDGESVGSALSQLWRTGAGAFPGGAFVLDDQAGNLRALVREAGVEGADMDAEAVLDAALAEFAARQQHYEAALASPARPTMADHARTLDRALVVVGDAGTVHAQLGKERAADLVRLMAEGPRHAMPVVMGGTLATAGKGPDDVAKAAKKVTAGLVVGKISDQSVLKATNVPYKEPELGESEAYIVADGKAVRVKLPASP
ncbi:type VII secretion protein EssC [Cellulomonas sp. Marseille-Q8402]